MPTPTPTPTVNVASLRDKWKRYTHPTYGFSFEYPVLYDYAPYEKGCGVQALNDGLGGLSVGSLNYVFVIPVVTKDLRDYVQKFAELQQAQRGWVIEAIRDIQDYHYPAVTLEYRTDAAGGRYGMATYFYDTKKSLAVAFNIVGFDTACDISGSQINEYSLREHLLETFEFEP